MPANVSRRGALGVLSALGAALFGWLRPARAAGASPAAPTRPPGATRAPTAVYLTPYRRRVRHWTTLPGGSQHMNICVEALGPTVNVTRPSVDPLFSPDGRPLPWPWADRDRWPDDEAGRAYLAALAASGWKDAPDVWVGSVGYDGGGGGACDADETVTYYFGYSYAFDPAAAAGR
jgi:hypothetical protein